MSLEMGGLEYIFTDQIFTLDSGITKTQKCLAYNICNVQVVSACD